MAIDIDIEFMKFALGQAELAMMKNEVPVGAVLVSESGELIAFDHNQTISLCDPAAHAEILTLRKAAKKTMNYRLLNSTLYVTIEPCIMCIGAIINARVKRVVFGAFEPKWGACGSLYDFSKDQRLNHRVEITSKVLENDCTGLIQNFFKTKR